MKETTEISNTQDVIDVRDVIARFEALDAMPIVERSEYEEEYALLQTLLDDLKGNGGDEKWRGAWYPIVLVRDSYFTEHAQEEAESLGLVKNNAEWPYRHIDWAQAASELQQDYTTVEFGNETYWYR